MRMPSRAEIAAGLILSGVAANTARADDAPVTPPEVVEQAEACVEQAAALPIERWRANIIGAKSLKVTIDTLNPAEVMEDACTGNPNFVIERFTDVDVRQNQKKVGERENVIRPSNDNGSPKTIVVTLGKKNKFKRGSRVTVQADTVVYATPIVDGKPDEEYYIAKDQQTSNIGSFKVK